jgi:hypothetical protein
MPKDPTPLKKTSCSDCSWKVLETGLLGALILMSLTGCASKKPVPPPQMTLNVQSDPAANQGQVFYLLTRSVTDRQFLSDTYQSVASLVFADPPDPAVLGAHAIVPGRKQEIKIVQPTQNALAFYFLFTEPGDHWKKMVSQPVASAYNIGISQGEGVVIEKHKGFFRRLWPF